MPGCNERSYVFIKTKNFELQDFVSTYGILLSPGIKGLRLFFTFSHKFLSVQVIVAVAKWL